MRGLVADYAPGSGNQTVVWSADDSEGVWGPSTSSSLLEVAIAGVYSCAFAAGRTLPGTTQTWTVSLRINGSPIAGPILATTAVAVAAGGTFVAELEEGDTIDLRIGGAGTGSLVAIRTYLHVLRVAPVRWT